MKSIEESINGFQTSILSLEQNQDGSAMVSATEKGYGVARSPIGPFAVSIDRATPYLDGYKIKFASRKPLNCYSHWCEAKGYIGPSVWRSGIQA
jgi:hypothetical protein